MVGLQGTLAGGIMKRVLLTGGTGFIGRNVIPILRSECVLFTPSRDELNLLDEDAVRRFIKNNGIEIVIHSANPNPVKNGRDHSDKMFEDSLRCFMNLYRCENLYQLMYTVGSGAEYNKERDIISIKEEEEFRSIPKDSYGFAKYIMNSLICKSNKQCNLRVFGCYGPTDYFTKFITHAINCCIDKTDITIRQNCYFDYIQVTDFAKILLHFIYNSPQYRSYNVCTGKKYSLIEIANIVKMKMDSDSDIKVLRQGINNEYTGDNSRLLNEFDYSFLTIEQGIQIQIDYELKNREKK